MFVVLRQLRFLLPSAESVATGAPLIAALLAPAATLFDIPALSQRWYSFNGAQLSDPPASLILSAISLAFSVLANALLVLRFCVHNPRGWRIAIFVSTMSWFMKTAIGFSNLIVFGATRRNGPGFTYIEGFWCAIMSVILSGFVTILLTAHYMTNRRDRPEGSVNLDCRMLIISEMILFAVMALEALIFCKIEGWTYLDGLYFSVVSLLTIGFGNFAPTKASTKVLLFPFSIAGIALLSNQVTLITSVSSRLTKRYRQRLNYGPKLHQKLTRQLTRLSTRVDDVKNAEKTSSSSAENDDLSENDELMREVHRLKRLYTLQEGASEMFEFLFSLLLLVVFWFVSGAIFQAIEGWTFGDAMYFSYIFFLTIGYGDYAPNTPAGKTVFVFWAMLAVPIMTNFVVQTIQTIVSRTSTLLSNRARERKTEWFDYVATYFVPHTDLVDQVRASIDGEVENAQDREESSTDDEKGKERRVQDDEKKRESSASKKEVDDDDDGREMITISRSDLMCALEQSILLESKCRAMLIDHMKTGSAQWLLLKADSNVQRSRLMASDFERKAEKDEQQQRKQGDPNVVDELQLSSQDSMIERVGSYRQTYARFLVMAGRLMDLEGQDLFAWEHEVEKEGRSDRVRHNSVL